MFDVWCQEISSAFDSDCGNFFTKVLTLRRKVDPVKMSHKKLGTVYLTLDSLFYSLLLMSKIAPS